MDGVLPCCMRTAAMDSPNGVLCLCSPFTHYCRLHHPQWSVSMEKTHGSRTSVCSEESALCPESAGTPGERMSETLHVPHIYQPEHPVSMHTCHMPVSGRDISYMLI